MTTCPECLGTGFYEAEPIEGCTPAADPCPSCSKFAGYQLACSFRCWPCNGTGTQVPPFGNDGPNHLFAESIEEFEPDDDLHPIDQDTP